jgi:hypothetical protein
MKLREITAATAIQRSPRKLREARPRGSENDIGLSLGLL